jgi:hypothetical protein
VGYSLHREPEDEISRALPKLNELVKDGLLRPTIDSTVDFEDFEKGYSRLGSRKAVGSITLLFGANTQSKVISARSQPIALNNIRNDVLADAEIAVPATGEALCAAL